MTTARELMSENVTCAGLQETLTDIAVKMRDQAIGALPICGEDNELKGMITDRDIVVQCIAEGGDPSLSKAVDFAKGKPVTIGADDQVEEAMRTMVEHGVRRLPVIDGHKLVGMVAQADLAAHLGDSRTGDMLEGISEAPPNN